MLKKCLGFALTVIVLSSSQDALAQSYAESALLFSRTQSAGSARVQGMAGAQTAIGGDYSSALSNPAGLGMYNRSEFTLTPGLSFYNTKSTYETYSGINNPSLEESTTKFNIPGISFVLNLPKDQNGFLGGSFGFSFSRTNDFNSEIRYKGENTQNSIADFFIEQADGINYKVFDENYPVNATDLAYWNYLIGPMSVRDPDDPELSESIYFSDAPSWYNIDDNPANSTQQEEIKTARASNQWSFSYGGNYKDVFFFGGGIGLTSLRYTSEKNYSEEYHYSGNLTPVNRMALNETIDIRGSGINATLGVMVRPVQYFQFGLSFTTPTVYTITENYLAKMNSQWNNFEYEPGTTLNDVSDQTDEVISEYTLTTPLKLAAGVAFISKYGLVTVDVEKINPAKAKYSSELADVSYAVDNDEIRSLYKNAFSYRFGAEYRHKSLRVRGGYGFQESTYQDKDIDNSIQTVSGGVGLRKKTFAVDLAVVNRKWESFYSPYVLSNGAEPVAKLNFNNISTMLTVSFFF